MVKRILALSLLMVCLSACGSGGQEDPAGELMTDDIGSCTIESVLDGNICQSMQMTAKTPMYG